MNARFGHSCLALYYLYSYLLENLPEHCQSSTEVHVVEFSINDQPELILREIYELKPEIIGVSCYIWNITQIHILCRKLKMVCPEVIVIWGGPEVSHDAAQQLKSAPYVDFVVKGEGERAFCELISCLLTDGREARFSEIGGLAYRHNRDVLETDLAPRQSSLNSIPSPYTSATAIPDLGQRLSHRTCYIETSRGCPFRCAYCTSSIRPGVSYFDKERIFRDLDYLVGCGADQIKFVDRTFNASAAHAHTIWGYILEQIRRNQDWRKVRFHFEVSADLLTAESFSLLSMVPPESFEFEIGVQTTNQETLTEISRTMDWQKVQKNVGILRAMNNIHLHLDLIAGLPGDTVTSFRQSIADVYRLQPHRLQLGFLKLLKGTALRRQAAIRGYQFSPFPPYEVLKNPTVSFAELLEFHLLEDVIEKYHNTQRFQHSLHFLESGCSDPLAIMDALADFWRENKYYLHPHSNDSLYRLFWEFGRQQLTPKLNQALDQSLIFTELLKLDFLLQPGLQRLPRWFPQSPSQELKKQVQKLLADRSRRNQLLPGFSHLSLRELNQVLQVEVFSVDVISIADTREIQPSLLVPTAVAILARKPKNTCLRLPLAEYD